MKQAVVALSLVIVLLVGTNLWMWTSNVALHRELDEQQARMQKLVKIAKAQKAQVVSPAPMSSKSRAGRSEQPLRKKGKGGRGGPDPKKVELRDRIRDAKIDNRLDAVEELADERGWPEATADDVMSVFLDTDDELTAVRDEIAAGDLSKEEGRDEMSAIRDGVGDELTDILGPEEYKIFQDRIWGNGR